MADEHLAVEAHKGRHTGEYWLTCDEHFDGMALWDQTPAPRKDGNWWTGNSVPMVPLDGLANGLTPLADPDKPVKVRLQLTAERIEEEA